MDTWRGAAPDDDDSPVVQGDAVLLGSLLDRARTGSFPEDAILIELSPRDGQALSVNETNAFPISETVLHEVASPSALTLALGLRRDSRVHLLAKSPRNPFGGMITIGRAPNNDVVLSCSSVSKFHAYLRTLPRDELAVFDVGSTNGTRVDDRVPAIEGIRISTLARVTFGHRSFIYVSKPDVRAWLHAQIDTTRG